MSKYKYIDDLLLPYRQLVTQGTANPRYGLQVDTTNPLFSNIGLKIGAVTWYAQLGNGKVELQSTCIKDKYLAHSKVVLGTSLYDSGIVWEWNQGGYISFDSFADTNAVKSNIKVLRNSPNSTVFGAYPGPGKMGNMEPALILKAHTDILNAYKHITDLIVSDLTNPTNYQ